MGVVVVVKQKTAYEIVPSLVGSEMCIRGRPKAGTQKKAAAGPARGGCFFLGPGLGPWPLQCMHKSVVHAQECCACTRILCMHKSLDSCDKFSIFSWYVLVRLL